MLPGNIFGLILKNKMAARDVYSTLNKDFFGPVEQRVLWVEISNSQDIFLILKS